MTFSSILLSCESLQVSCLKSAKSQIFASITHSVTTKRYLLDDWTYSSWESDDRLIHHAQIHCSAFHPVDYTNTICVCKLALQSVKVFPFVQQLKMYGSNSVTFCLLSETDDNEWMGDNGWHYSPFLAYWWSSSIKSQVLVNLGLLKVCWNLL